MYLSFLPFSSFLSNPLQLLILYSNARPPQVKLDDSLYRTGFREAVRGLPLNETMSKAPLLHFGFVVEANVINQCVERHHFINTSTGKPITAEHSRMTDKIWAIMRHIRKLRGPLLFDEQVMDSRTGNRQYMIALYNNHTAQWRRRRRDASKALELAKELLGFPVNQEAMWYWDADYGPE